MSHLNKIYVWCHIYGILLKCTPSDCLFIIKTFPGIAPIPLHSSFFYNKTTYTSPHCNHSAPAIEIKQSTVYAHYRCCIYFVMKLYKNTFVGIAGLEAASNRDAWLTGHARRKNSDRLLWAGLCERELHQLLCDTQGHCTGEWYFLYTKKWCAYCLGCVYVHVFALLVEYNVR